MGIRMSTSVFKFDETAYGDTAAKLLLPRREADLGPGKPNRDAEQVLRGLTAKCLFAGRRIADHGMARACLAGLWLYHDFLDESHAISQELHTPTGSFWHGIMQRREEDYENAKYWFRRVGRHPVFGPLRDAASQAAKEASNESRLDPQAGFLATQSEWDPFRFVDLCAAALKGAGAAKPSLASLCRQVQSREWELLFDHCYRSAAGD